MSDQIAPPLDIDLNSVDTSMPLIADGQLVDFTLVKVEKVKTKAGGDMLSIQHKSITPTKAADGKDLFPGVLVFGNLNLAPSGKGTWDMVVRNIAAITQAAGITGTLAEFLNGGWQQLQGKTVRGKVHYVPEGPDKTGVVRKAKNEISLYIKP